MPIFTRRWNDAPGADEGLKVLVCRYRPRGVRKEEETWDVWYPELGPSAELHAAYYGKRGLAISWATYHHSYRREMMGQRERIADLARKVAAGELITLLCSSACEREDRCHRSLLRALIEEQVEKLSQAHRD
jgi:uncharacterized protein YeaO (DUF488 family)